jgi:hypothetical protein
MFPGHFVCAAGAFCPVAKYGGAQSECLEKESESI